jgi:hypothetical protein
LTLRNTNLEYLSLAPNFKTSKIFLIYFPKMR